MVALVDARTALATPTKRRALADENRRRADADEDASESASTAPLLRLDDETSPPPSSPHKAAQARTWLLVPRLARCRRYDAQLCMIGR